MSLRAKLLVSVPRYRRADPGLSLYVILSNIFPGDCCDINIFMKVPCRIKALKYVQYGKLEMSSHTYADVTLEPESSSRYRMIRVTNNNSSVTFTEAALEIGPLPL